MQVVNGITSAQSTSPFPEGAPFNLLNYIGALAFIILVNDCDRIIRRIFEGLIAGKHQRRGGFSV